MKTMRVLVVTPHYPPDGGPSAPLFGMLCEALAQRGADVTVVAAVPHYPTGRVAAEFRGPGVRHSLENGVRVLRVRVPSLDRARMSRRAFQFLCYQVGAAFTGLSRMYDIALFSNPAFDVWLPFVVHTLLRRTKTVFSVHDMYPDVGIALGVFHSRPVIAVVTALERFCLKHAASVRILSESFEPALTALGVPSSKLTLIYDYVDTDLVRPLPRNNVFARENELEGRFVVQYAGNIGLSQGLETVLSAAERVRTVPDVLFLFVGDGTGREPLIREARARRLDNVRFVPFQPRVRLPLVLASADVGLAVLKRGIGIQSLPSKVFSIFASGRPLLASVDERSATSALVERSGAGIALPPEDPVRLAEAILALRADPDLRDRLGRNGRQHALRHHSPGAAAERFEMLFRAVAGIPDA